MTLHKIYTHIGFKYLMAVILLAVLASMPVKAEIYQWRDADGRLHFGDKKPTHLEAEEVSGSVGKVNSDSSGVERKKLERLFKAETVAERAHRQRVEQARQQDQMKRQQQCDKAREHLAVLQGPVYFVREDGSTYSISETERELRASEMTASIENYCGP